LGKTKVRFEHDPINVQKLEQKALEEGDNFTLIDLAAMVPYFFNLSYIPYQLIAKINENEKFVTMPNTTLKEMFLCLLSVKYSEHPKIYVKIFEQLKLASANMNGNELTEVIQHIRELSDLKILDVDQEVKEAFQKDFIKYFINRLIDVQKKKSDIVGISHANIVKVLQNLKKLEVHNDNLEHSIVETLSDRLSTSINVIAEPIKYLSQKSKETLINNLLGRVKQKDTDIRSLKADDFANMFIAIIQTNEKEIKPFIKYLNNLLKSERDDTFSLKSLSEMYYVCTQYGYSIDSKILGKPSLITDFTYQLNYTFLYEL